VSFVNPHDIAYFYEGRATGRPEKVRPPLRASSVRRRASRSSPNFESDLSHKPALQAWWRDYGNAKIGVMGGADDPNWTRLLNLYLLLHTYVDREIGAVLSALGASEFGSNTIVLVTSTTATYAGSHGMRTKKHVASTRKRCAFRSTSAIPRARSSQEAVLRHARS